MKLLELIRRELDIPFRTTFRHASAVRSRSATVIVTARAQNGAIGFGESCPRPYVTGETVVSACQFIDRHRDDLIIQVKDLTTLLAWRDRHSDEIATNPAAYAAIELALLDAIGKDEGLALEDLLEVPRLPRVFYYSAVLGDTPWPIYTLQLWRYRRRGFNDFKIKLSGNPARDRRKLAPFRRSRARVRADANNLWPDAGAAITAIKSLDFPLFALEEPVAAHHLDDCRLVATALGIPIVLDESFLDVRTIHQLVDAERWIVNLRVSKLGGLTRALEALYAARSRGLRVVVGAQVGETSILTRAGLTLAAAAGDALVAQEGAFGTHLLQWDLASPPLMFQEGGELRPAAWVLDDAPGLGLNLALSVAVGGCRRPASTSFPTIVTMQHMASSRNPPETHNIVCRDKSGRPIIR